ncbi:hypothetical protein D5086_019864 [Populus alba]|uniref:Uncharacterized protein n=1 Tax=Populus alba TaxID=43335 RepID=A0ACC4BIC8_POPAL
MKREHSNLHPQQLTNPSSLAAGGYSFTSTGTMTSNNGKATTWEEEKGRQADGGMDELLAVLGYKVRSSDMAEVAQKLEQLEEVMGHAQEDGLSHLASDSVHYNPSDLSTWLESMLSELNPNHHFDPSADSLLGPAESSTVTSIDFTDRKHHQQPKLFEESSSSEYDLKVIPGKAVFSPTQIDSRESKRLKTDLYQTSSSPSSSSTTLGSLVASTESTRPVVLVDSQENGVRLVHLLMACAEAVQGDNLNLAEALVKQIGFLAVSQAGAMRKVATYFAEALARRIYKLYPQNSIDHSLSDILQIHFYETCPYLKPGGPPAFRLTGIGPPAHDNTDQLQEVGWKLAQLAETIHVEFEYRGFVANSLADLDASMLELRPPQFDRVRSTQPDPSAVLYDMLSWD